MIWFKSKVSFPITCILFFFLTCLKVFNSLAYFLFFCFCTFFDDFCLLFLIFGEREHSKWELVNKGKYKTYEKVWILGIEDFKLEIIMFETWPIIDEIWRICKIIVEIRTQFISLKDPFQWLMNSPDWIGFPG